MFTYDEWMGMVNEAYFFLVCEVGEYANFRRVKYGMCQILNTTSLRS